MAWAWTASTGALWAVWMRACPCRGRWRCWPRAEVLGLLWGSSPGGSVCCWSHDPLWIRPPGHHCWRVRRRALHRRRVGYWVFRWLRLTVAVVGFPNLAIRVSISTGEQAWGRPDTLRDEIGSITKPAGWLHLSATPRPLHAHSASAPGREPAMGSCVVTPCGYGASLCT